MEEKIPAIYDTIGKKSVAKSGLRNHNESIEIGKKNNTINCDFSFHEDEVYKIEENKNDAVGNNVNNNNTLSSGEIIFPLKEDIEEPKQQKIKNPNSTMRIDLDFLKQSESISKELEDSYELLIIKQIGPELFSKIKNCLREQNLNDNTSFDYTIFKNSLKEKLINSHEFTAEQIDIALLYIFDIFYSMIIEKNI